MPVPASDACFVCAQVEKAEQEKQTAIVRAQGEVSACSHPEFAGVAGLH